MSDQVPNRQSVLASALGNAVVIVATACVVLFMLVILAAPAVLNLTILPISVDNHPCPPFIPFTWFKVIVFPVATPACCGVIVVSPWSALNGSFTSKYGPVSPKSTSVKVQLLWSVLVNFSGWCKGWTIYITSADCANFKSKICAEVYSVTIS